MGDCISCILRKGKSNMNNIKDSVMFTILTSQNIKR